MCTQNIPAFAQSPLVSTSALFLNPRGRVLFDTLVTKIPKFELQEPAFYIDVHKKQAADFLSEMMALKLLFSDGVYSTISKITVKTDLRLH